MTNFLLVRLDRADVTAPELADRLLREGIAIRTFTEEQHLDARFFRVAVRTEEENAPAVRCLGSVRRLSPLGRFAALGNAIGDEIAALRAQRAP